MVNFNPDWLRNQVYWAKKVENTIFHHSRANNFRVTGPTLLIIKFVWDLVPINTSCKFGPDWLRSQVLFALTRFKTAIFNKSRAINFHDTMWISLIIEPIWDLVPINTLCNFGPGWLRNVVSTALKRTDDGWTMERRWSQKLYPSKKS